VSPNTGWGDLLEAEQLVLADAQTSGGLLIAVTVERAGALREKLSKRGVLAAEIGTVEDGGPGHLEMRGRVGR
jgi:selenide,water dikinase